jgi:ankyrin repeat protein
MKRRFFLVHLFFHSAFVCLASVLLVMLAWSNSAFCGEIHDAAGKGDLEKIKALLKDNPELISSKLDGSLTALHIAAMHNNKDVLQLLLTNKAEVNSRERNGATPLHIAAMMGNKEIVKLLLVNKADVNARDEYGATPLHLAAQKGKKAVRPMHSAEFTTYGSYRYGTLETTVEPNYKDVVELLLAYKADSNAKDNNGVTPLYYAEVLDCADVAEVLRKHSNHP